MSLEPITPEHALELYLQDKEAELARSTIYSHKSRLSYFVEWCNENGIDNLNDLTGRKVHEYRIWRRNVGDLSKPTEKTQMDTVRVFLRWCEAIEAVPEDLSTKVQSPDITPEENTREVTLEAEEAEEVLAYLRKYQYASIEHVTLTLLWRTMMRRGAVKSLDIGDYNREEQYLDTKHRPDSGTPLKNKNDGERMIALDDKTCELLDDWIEDRRPDITDEYGRKALLATNYGRIHESTVQAYVYRYTRPCVYQASCPHGRDEESCEALPRDAASKCPSSVSPHAVRRGAITHHLRQDIPERAVSDRANVSLDVLEQHYDQRSKRDKMEQRREFLNRI
jgi:integrase